MKREMKRVNVAALGDSITKGVILTENQRYSIAENSYIDIISNQLELNIRNYGKFGCTIDFGDKIIVRNSEQITGSDYTFLEYGGNDCDFDWLKIAESPSDNHLPKTSLDSFKEKFTFLIERIRELGSKPVIISLPPILSDTYFSFFSRFMSDEQRESIIHWLGGDTGIISRWHESYNRALFMVANRTNVPIIDITTPFDTYRGDISSLFCSDGIHPNGLGHRLIAETIINSVQYNEYHV